MKKLYAVFQWFFIVLFGLNNALPGYAMPAATIFTVNSAADVAGVSGDTVCETDPGNGICTLRAAIMAANHIPAGGATIIIPAGIFTLTIAPVGTDDETTGDLNVTQDMNIQGAGAARTFIDASGLVPGDRVLHIIGANLTLS
jgi:CSLREA domain-containing protein